MNGGTEWARALAQLQIAGAALLFATGGAAIKATAFTSWQIAAFRSALAVVLLTAALPQARSRWTVPVAIAGLAQAPTMILFVAANKLTTAMNPIFLQYTAPLYVLLLGRVLLRERFRLYDLGVMGLIVSALVLFLLATQSPVRTAPRPLLGNITAGTSGLCRALTLLGFRWLGRRKGRPDAALTAVVIGNLIAVAVCLPMSLPVRGGTPADWMAVGFPGVFLASVGLRAPDTRNGARLRVDRIRDPAG